MEDTGKQTILSLSLDDSEQAKTYEVSDLDKKIKKLFPGESVNKKMTKTGILTSRALPSFVSDWLISKFSKDEILDVNGLQHFLDNYLPEKTKADEIKHRLMSDSQRIKLLAEFKVVPNIQSGEEFLEIPLLDIGGKEGIVDPTVLDKSPTLLNGGSWGVGELTYSFPESKQKNGKIVLKKFDEFRPYSVNIEYFRQARNHFNNTEEWIDFLIKCMEYDPSSFKGLENKLWMLCRLLPFVEPRINLIELAPKGTGKSYVFGRLSKYGWLVSGGSVTRAQLFFDITRKRRGIISRYDYIAFDEIQTINFGSNPDEVIGALKGYLESGHYNIAHIPGEAESGLIILGNIEMTFDKKPVNSRYFDSLPKFMQETAFIDRFHGFIEGWKLPRITVGGIGKGYALNSEYFSEVLHTLRKDTVPAAIVEKIFQVPANADERDRKAISKISVGLLKLIYPNVRKYDDLDINEFEKYCFNQAVAMRSIIRQQLHKMDEEFVDSVPNIKIKNN